MTLEHCSCSSCVTWEEKRWNGYEWKWEGKVFFVVAAINEWLNVNHFSSQIQVLMKLCHWWIGLNWINLLINLIKKIINSSLG